MHTAALLRDKRASRTVGLFAYCTFSLRLLKTRLYVVPYSSMNLKNILSWKPHFVFQMGLEVVLDSTQSLK